MLATGGVILTTAGSLLISRSLELVKPIEFTHMKIGTGDISSIAQAKKLNDLVASYKNINMSTLVRSGDLVRVRGSFTNDEITETVRIKEVGVFAKIGTEQPILFGYVNDGEGELIPPGTSGVIARTRDLYIGVTGEAEVAITINKSLVYATIEDLEEGLNRKEDKYIKRSGWNLDKTDLTENDSNKLFTPKGALNLFNTLTTNFTNGINAAKEVLRLDIVKKLDKTANAVGIESGGCSIVAHRQNEMNFKSTYTDNSFFINYRTLPGSKKVTNFYFGDGSAAPAGKQNATFFLNDIYLNGFTTGIENVVANINELNDKKLNKSGGTIEKTLTFGTGSVGIREGDVGEVILVGSKPYIQVGNNYYRIYHQGFKPTKEDINLDLVNNWDATSAVNDPSNSKYATAGAVKTANDNANNRILKENGIANNLTVDKYLRFGDYDDDTVINTYLRGGVWNTLFTDIKLGNNFLYHTGRKPTKSDVGLSKVDNTADSEKNVLSATKLKTSRTITIGNKSYSFDGSNNISYTLADIGALSNGGGTITGLLISEVQNAEALRHLRNGKYSYLGNNGAGIAYFGIRSTTDSTDDSYIEVGTNHLKLRTQSKSYNLYYEGNKPTASDVGALSITGGEVSGALSARGLIQSKIAHSEAISVLTNKSKGYIGIGQGGEFYCGVHSAESTADDTFIKINKGQNLLFAKGGHGTYTVYHEGFRQKMIKTLIWSGKAGNMNGVVLNQNIANFDFIMFVSTYDSGANKDEKLISVDSLKAGSNTYLACDEAHYIINRMINGTTFGTGVTTSDKYIREVYGITLG